MVDVSVPGVLRLSSERFDEVVETLCAAFRDYPVMRFVLRGSGDAYDEHLRLLIGYFTDSRFQRSWPVLGIDRGKSLVAAANVNPPEDAPAPPALQDRFAHLAEAIGEDAMGRFQAFARACDRLEPSDPHYYLGMIGVRPGLQGDGYGRALLEAVHVLSENDPRSAGVALSTETRENLSLYEHFGYRVLGEARAGDLVTWTLFRPDSR